MSVFIRNVQVCSSLLQYPKHVIVYLANWQTCLWKHFFFCFEINLSDSQIYSFSQEQNMLIRLFNADYTLMNSKFSPISQKPHSKMLSIRGDHPFGYRVIQKILGQIKS